MLLFIYILFGTLCTTAPVSIHLMLLFISKHFHIYQIFYKFQYISCYSLSCFSRRSVIFHIPFNTSHVTLYQAVILYTSPCTYVSIHLMLLFIYSEGNTRKEEQNVSIHLMLLFIWFGGLIRNAVRSFNTSHVTLYQ